MVVPSAEQNTLRVAMAMSGYDHVRDLVAGTVTVEGIEIDAEELPVEQIFSRFERETPWDVVEFSLAKYVAYRARGRDDIIALPVFPSRVFRQSAFYVRDDSFIEHPAQLAGARVGVAEWAQTAGVVARDWLCHDVGVALSSIEWHQAGVDEPGREETIPVVLPPGVSCEARPEATLNDLLLDGSLDAVLSARPPAAAGRGLRQLLRASREVEQAYAAAGGTFPIMHVVVCRTDLLRANPWVAGALVDGFEEAKERSFGRLRDRTTSYLPLPWVPDHLAEVEATLGDPLPYGFAPNEAALRSFTRACVEQGIAPLAPEPVDLFWPT